MNISSLLAKGLLVKGSLALSGVSGASAASWYVYDSINPTGYSSLNSYTFSPIFFQVDSSGIDLDLKITTSSSHSIGSNTCFNVFFGVNTMKAFSPGSSTVNIPDNSDQTGTGKIEGCTMMALFEDSSNKHAFGSETVIKDEKTGIAVLIETNNLKTTNLRYSVVFLKKETEWKIKGGFIANELKNTDSKQIKSPDGSIKIDYSKVTSDSSDTPTWKSKKYYSAILEDTEEDNSEWFKDVFQILNKTGSNYGGDVFSKIHTLSETQISTQPSTQSLKLEKWFKPFENKKVKWKNLEDACREKAKLRNLNEVEINWLRNYCFR